MANNKTKNIAVLMVVIVLTGGGSLMLSAQSTTKSDSSKSQISTLFSRDPNAPSQKVSGPVSRELFLKMTFSVLLVVSLGIAAVYLSKKFIPKLTNMPGKEIRILETTHLGPRKAVHLVEVGSQKLLIGSTNESITTLAHIADIAIDLPTQESNESIQV